MQYRKSLFVMFSRVLAISVILMVITISVWWAGPQIEVIEDQHTLSIVPQSRTDSVSSFGRQKNLPKSLEGTKISFPLLVDEHGELIVNDALVELIEWYLSSLGELTLDQIKLRILEAMSNTLSGIAFSQGELFLNRYLDYKNELGELQRYINEQYHGLSHADQIRIKKEKLQEIRSKYFHESEYLSLFKAEDEYDDFLMNHLTIVNDANLNPEEKQQLIEENERRLPESVQINRRNAMKFSEAQVNVSSLKKDGASAEEIFEYRSQMLGEESAHSLAKLDEERAAWQSRIDTFEIEKSRVLASGLSKEDQKIELTRLLQASFSEIEVVRVRAITKTY